MPMTTRPPTQLYLISPPRFDPNIFAAILRETLAAGPVAAFQLRIKDERERPVPDADILHTAQILMPVVQQAGTAFILNDRPDLAARLSADGVHIGQDDMVYDAARRWLGDSAIIGVTCHDSRHLAMEAAEAGADYVAFGAFFDTATKAPKSKAPLDLLTWWQDLMETPCVAIGGITLDNCAAVARAGADFVAVSAGVWDHPAGAPAAVAAFTQTLRAPAA
jgi:thiamine-phosphate pyrophosphorylase